MITGASFTSVTVTATFCEEDNPSGSVAVTIRSKTLSPFASPAVSKSGAPTKLITPAASIANKAASAPVREKVNVSPSTSVAVAEEAAVWFSATDTAAALVITGSSFTSVTVTATACVVVTVPSEAFTIMSKTLSAPASPGISKSGAPIKVMTPAPSIANKAASVPVKVKVMASPSASVAAAVKAPVWFSATDTAAALVITGASFTSVTVTVIA